MKPSAPHIIAVMLLGLAIGACGEKRPATQPASQPSQLTSVPVEVTVKQRSTTAVPGSEGRLVLTVDDVTRNQVMVSLAGDAGAAVLPARSMSPADPARFTFGGRAYDLTLKNLDNALTGEDFVTFVISHPSTTGLTEDAKIERLIQAVGDLKGGTFLRNGAEHSAAEAADHLRSKWRAKAGEIKTAEQFIRVLASQSSLSGQPYQIRLPNGRVIPAGQYLRERLAEIENGR